MTSPASLRAALWRIERQAVRHDLAGVVAAAAASTKTAADYSASAAVALDKTTGDVFIRDVIRLKEQRSPGDYQYCPD